MTATVVLDLVEETEGVSLESKVLIVPRAANINGTSAELMCGDLLTIEELLYALMLPSGNDAAVSLALYCGVLLAFKGEIDPNSYLNAASDNAIDLELQTPCVIDPPNIEEEPPEQRRQKNMNRYDLWQDQRYYELTKDSKSSVLNSQEYSPGQQHAAEIDFQRSALEDMSIDTSYEPKLPD